MIGNGLQAAVNSSIQSWLAQHPNIAWMVAHPLWAIALLVLFIFLCWSLLGALVQATQNIWLFILQAPLKLTRLIFWRTFQLFKRTDALPSPQPEPLSEPQQRLTEIFDRLEALRQEQAELIQEVRSLLQSQPSLLEKSR